MLSPDKSERLFGTLKEQSIMSVSINSIVTEEFDILHMTQAIGNQIMDLVSDADVNYRLNDKTPTLGELCRGIGEVQRTYIDGFKNFKMDYFSYRHPDPTIATSADRLRAWFAELDAEMDSVLRDMSEADVQSRPVDRGPDFSVPVRVNVHVYREALLIFYGRATLYLNALGKGLPEQVVTWIG